MYSLEEVWRPSPSSGPAPPPSPSPSWPPPWPTSPPSLSPSTAPCSSSPRSPSPGARGRSLSSHPDQSLVMCRLFYLISCLLNSLAMMSSCCLLYIWLSLALHHLLAQYHLLFLLLLTSVTVITAGLVTVIIRLSGVSDGAEVDRLRVSTDRRENIIKMIGEDLDCLLYSYSTLLFPGDRLSLVTWSLRLPPSSVVITKVHSALQIIRFSSLSRASPSAPPRQLFSML